MSGLIPSPSFTSAGPQPATPAALNQLFIAVVLGMDPGFTANLPGSLLEDLTSTGTGALMILESDRVEAINNLSPVTQNPYVLNLQGQQEGIPQGSSTNTSVYVVFAGPSGYIIVPGFTVSDGTYQYVVQDGGAIGSSGLTSPLFCVATQPGIWTPLINSVTTIVTSVPSGYAITCNNPTSGTPGSTSQTVESYRAELLQAAAFTVQGTADAIKTSVLTIPGVNPRLVSVLQVSGGWEVIVGGGDPYEVAAAIYSAVLDLGTIVGSQTANRNITTAIISPPNNYSVVRVNPPDQIVTMTVTWNTSLGSFTGGQQVNQLAQPAITSYVNSIIVGQAINLLEMTETFLNSVASVIDAVNIIVLTFSVSINGIPTSPSAGTSIIPGDPESFFSAAQSAVAVVQG